MGFESKGGHPCSCQNCSRWSPGGKKTGRGFLLNRPSCPPDDLNFQRIELNLVGALRLLEAMVMFSCLVVSPQDRGVQLQS